MKSKISKIDFKLYTTKIFIISLSLAFGIGKAYSQCNYIITENGAETKIGIPCDFPVKISYDELNVDQINFEKEITKWKIINPTFQSLNFNPSNTKSQNNSIQIPISEYNKFDFEKKIVIDRFSYFYKKVEQNK